MMIPLIYNHQISSTHCWHCGGAFIVGKKVYRRKVKSRNIKTRHYCSGCKEELFGGVKRYGEGEGPRRIPRVLKIVEGTPMEFVFAGEDNDGQVALGGGFDPFFGGINVITVNVSKSTHCWHCGKRFVNPASSHCEHCGESSDFEGDEDITDIIDSIEHEVLHKVVSGMGLSPEVEELVICLAACGMPTFTPRERIPDER